MKALVTGGSSGLGRAMVEQLAGSGTDVVSVDRDEPADFNGLVHIACDLSDRGAVDNGFAAVVAAGPYDVAIFNAGVSATGPFEDIPAHAYRRLMTVNAETPMVMAAHLMQKGVLKKHLCLVASLSHYTGYPGAAVYAASKDVVAAYAKSVRKPFARNGVSVTLACPGPLRTAHAARHAPEGAKEDARMLPDVAARAILVATLKGERLVIPGAGPKAFALAGKLFPQLVTGQMKRLIHDRLSGPVW